MVAYVLLFKRIEKRQLLDKKKIMYTLL